MKDPIFFVAIALTLVVAGVLLFGISTYLRGGEFNKRNGNRIMRWRLYMQFAAVLALVGFAWIRSKG